MQSPKELGFFQPAEWEPHDACWLAFPSHADLWLDSLADAQAEFVALAREIGRSERLEILVLAETLDLAQTLLADVPAVRFHPIPFGDIWLRDIAPIFVRHQQDRQIAALTFQWNGWGGSHLLDHDDRVAGRVAQLVSREQSAEIFGFDWVLEGGAIETDGQGTCLTTRQCLLNPNRNPHLSQAEIEAGLKAAIGVEKILWLGDGLQNDHTDGHIDTIARFVAPAKVMYMEPQSTDDPNYAAMIAIRDTLRTFTDACDRPIEAIPIPSPGAVLDPEGHLMPASYLNFYIANESVIVPIYGTSWDQQAVAAIGQYFPTRRTIGYSAKAILLGGGAFHCITQQQPRPLSVTSL